MAKVDVLNLIVKAMALPTMILVVAPVNGDGQRLLWQDIVDVGNFDQAFDVDAAGNQVFVAGFVGESPFARDFLIRAYNAHKGTLLWQDRVDKGSSDYAAGVVAEGKRVFVSGAVGPLCCHDWLVRAYDADSGRLLWEDRFDKAGRGDRPHPGILAVSEGLLIVGGSADNTRFWVIRAYDAATGTLMWQDQFEGGPGFTAIESLVVQRGRVFAGGSAATAFTDDVVVRAYKARTGKLLWEHRSPGPKAGGFTTARGLGSDESRVFVGASLPNASGKYEFVVQALEALNGAPAWEDRMESGGDIDQAYGIAVHGGRVFAQGTGGLGCLFELSPPSDCDNLIRSYNATTGALLWNRAVGVRGIDDGNSVQVILAPDGRLYAALAVNFPSANPSLPQGDWLVQTYRGSTGRLLWEDKVDTGGARTDQGEIPLGLAVSGGRLFVAGRTVNAADNWNFVVRAYQADGGAGETDVGTAASEK